MEKKDFLKILKSYYPRIQKAKDSKLNEADTRFLFRTILDKTFGYNALDDISAEEEVKGTYVDLAVKINNKYIFFIEIKSADTDLKVHHVKQVAHYASEAGVKFALLTNLSQYWLYQIEWSNKKVEYIPIFQHDILAEDIKKVGENLWLLTKKLFNMQSLRNFAKLWKHYLMKIY